LNGSRAIASLSWKPGPQEAGAAALDVHRAVLDIQLDSDVNSSHIAWSASVTDPRSATTVASLPDSLIALATR